MTADQQPEPFIVHILEDGPLPKTPPSQETLDRITTAARTPLSPHELARSVLGAWVQTPGGIPDPVRSALRYGNVFTRTGRKEDGS